jgi:hypothetical protein
LNKKKGICEDPVCVGDQNLNKNEGTCEDNEASGDELADFVMVEYFDSNEKRMRAISEGDRIISEDWVGTAEFASQPKGLKHRPKRRPGVEDTGTNSRRSEELKRKCYL